MRISARKREQAGSGREAAASLVTSAGAFPAGAAILLGVGFGAFFDGIVFHQLLQWHHMVSSWYPPDNLPNLRLNTVWDGLFHSLAYVLLVIAVYLLMQAARAGRPVWPGRALPGCALMGWGLFNLAEGVLDHLALGVHHVNELVDVRQRWLWDGGFLLWGALMLVLGWLLRKGARVADGTDGHV
jgi:uncharacterized membrane protein